jgi:hypothetical protein
MKTTLYAFALMLSVLTGGKATMQFIPTVPATKTASTSVAFTTSGGNNYACGSATNCTYTLTTNPTAGQLLLVDLDGNSSTATLTLTNVTGTGCPSSWTKLGSTLVTGTVYEMTVWYGVATGTGSCEVNGASSPATNMGITYQEWSGQSGSPIDVTACPSYNTNCTATSSATPLAITAAAGSAQSNEGAAIFWIDDSGNGAGTTTGWTRPTNFFFDGNMYKLVPTAGTTVSASIGGLGTSPNAAFLVVIQ